jgi:hypothetical protein
MNILIFAMLSCVSSDIAYDYAKRSHPECQDIKTLGHNHTKDGSLTEVSLTCGENTRSISVKCIFGLGVFSDTVCHENN